MSAPSFIPYTRHEITPVDLSFVALVMRAQNLSGGREIELLEDDLREITGVEHAVACSSGTAALWLAMHIEEEFDEVAVSPLTFVAGANCAKLSGREVRADVEVLVDYQEDGTAFPGCAIVTDYTGEVLPLPKAGAAHYVVRDAAHSFGAHGSEGEILIGADVACLSFHPTKVVTGGEGGALLTNSAVYARRARAMLDGGREGWDCAAPGLNLRMPTMCAALLRSQLLRLSSLLDRRREIADRYAAAFGNIDAIVHMVGTRWSAPAVSAWHLAVLMLRHGDARPAAQAGLHERGIGTQIHYRALSEHTGWHHLRGHDLGADLAPNVLTIPLFPSMTDDEVDRVITAVQEVLG